MMMRMLNNHTEVHAINEPHFFEKMWSPGDGDRQISEQEATDLWIRLMVGQRDGFFASVSKNGPRYKAEAGHLIGRWQGSLTRMSVYKAFLAHETQLARKRIPCEKTPQNVFYIPEISKAFPEGRVIHMVRDPRSVMLSQKRKWKRKSLGADFMSKREMRRLRINYHPITISRLWNASIGAGSASGCDDQVMHLRFEDLVNAPEKHMEEVCRFAGISYQEAMLHIPQAGSSSQADQMDQKGIRKDRASSWTQSGLTPEEIYLCERICRRYMVAQGYDTTTPRPRPLHLLWLYLTFPVKLVLALAVNLGRMRSIFDTLKRRWRAK